MNGDVPFPRTPVEKELERIQRMVTKGKLAEERRRELINELYRGGMTQVEIAARLSRASNAAGGNDVGEDGVYKIVKQMRMRRSGAR